MTPFGFTAAEVGAATFGAEALGAAGAGWGAFDAAAMSGGGAFDLGAGASAGAGFGGSDGLGTLIQANGFSPADFGLMESGGDVGIFGSSGASGSAPSFGEGVTLPDGSVMDSLGNIVDKAGTWIGNNPLLAATLGGRLAQGFFGANAAQTASGQQAAAANRALDIQTGIYNNTRGDLTPYREAGVSALSQLQGLTGSGPGGDPLSAPLTKFFSPSDLDKTPGYQFTLDQGLKALQNSYASKGLGISGNALRGVADYTTGLAQNTYLSQANLYKTQQKQAFDMLMGQTQLGEQAAVGAGQLGVQSGANIGSTLTGLGQAQAAGTLGQANAFGNALGSLPNDYVTAALLQRLGNLQNSSTPAKSTDFLGGGGS